MKTKFSTDSVNRVTVAYDSEFRGRVERTFSCPPDGGYVIELFRNGDSSQVCDKLAHRGSTLRCASRDDLLDLIRREYRAMRAAERRDNAVA